MQQTIRTPLYSAGIDLALRAGHLAGLLDDQGCAAGNQMRFGRTYDEMEAMFSTITSRVPEGCDLVWGCEATGAAWRSVTAFLLAKGQVVSLENPAAIAALRDVDSRFLKDDHVDARTIGEMVLRRRYRRKPLCPVPSPHSQGVRSLGRDVEKLSNELSSVKTRFSSLLCDQLLPSLKPSDHEWASPTLMPVLHKFADPRQIARLKLEAFINKAKKIGGPRTSEAALTKLYQAAVDAVRCYGDNRHYYEAHAFRLQDAILAITQLEDRIKSMRQFLSDQLAEVRTEEDVRHGLSVPGVGESTLDILMAFYGPPREWPSFKAMKRLAGTVPVVERSGNTDCPQRMSKLGDPVLRKIIFQIGNVARRYDAECAAIYYDQMVNKGKGHVAACIAAGLWILNCLRAVLRDGKEYESRHPETGKPIDREKSRELAQTLYTVPEEIRAARSKHKPNPHEERKQPTQPNKPSDGTQRPTEAKATPSGGSDVRSRKPGKQQPHSKKRRQPEQVAPK